MDHGLSMDTKPTPGGATFNEIDRILGELAMCPRCRI
jgi:hypothetical protein